MSNRELLAWQEPSRISRLSAWRQRIRCRWLITQPTGDVVLCCSHNIVWNLKLAKTLSLNNESLTNAIGMLYQPATSLGMHLHTCSLPKVASHDFICLPASMLHVSASSLQACKVVSMPLTNLISLKLSEYSFNVRSHLQKKFHRDL